MSTALDSSMDSLQIGTNGERSVTPSPPNSPQHNESCNIAPLTPSQSPRHQARTHHSHSFSVVVAIDFGTTSSGYAFSFTKDPEAIHMMRKWEGGDPGVANQKTPTSLLLTPEQKFHSFGFTARDYYHDLDPEDAREWLYFEKFKMKIHSTTDLTMETELEAVNGKRVKALEVFAHALSFFKKHALQELKEQCPASVENYEIRWVITVPAIWKQPAKQFMREAAYMAGLISPDDSDQLLIALEPEAASIYCRKLRLHQLIELSDKPLANGFEPGSPINSNFRQAREQLRRSRHSRTFVVETGMGELWSEMQTGDRYIVADCGGGTVDLTVHQIEQPQGTLKELYKASGGPYGALGVDLAFEKLLCQIFGKDFIETFKAKRPAAWVDLMIAFEARKRTASPRRANPLNISLPFSFIDFYKKHTGQSVEAALKKSSMNIVKWSSQGMLRMTSDAMNDLFQETIDHILHQIDDLMKKPDVSGVKFLFLVGGFAESPVLQHAVQSAFGKTCRVIIPQDVGLTILKGAVLFGLDPTIVRVRRSPLTYGVGVLNKFVEGKHPKEKLLVKEGKNWCTDIFDRFVSVDQSVALGEVVKRSYTPARLAQRKIIINIYCSATDDVVYITDPGVRKCGTINLELSEPEENSPRKGRREIQASMQFGDTEIKVTAVDVATSKSVKAMIDFLSN
ncbi:heat shock 70 kDa protein 12B [Protopterus annectens]|uniref:heat shock 70 kDa protein 12B n=1 Tax=Protopterus annectens TaxID=7888 RepID=UPI001CFAB3F8|nr:heat shock 70 kDa protein 12B [Protopterus annectens]XP_043920007.1 heat shock 70 kDa protein 12B [Protopterus annectens]